MHKVSLTPVFVRRLAQVLVSQLPVGRHETCQASRCIHLTHSLVSTYLNPWKSKKPACKYDAQSRWRCSALLACVVRLIQDSTSSKAFSSEARGLEDTCMGWCPEFKGSSTHTNMATLLKVLTVDAGALM